MGRDSHQPRGDDFDFRRGKRVRDQVPDQGRNGDRRETIWRIAPDD